MPKVDIDYSNTIFYKIFCKDSDIKDLYVGLTTNFVQRRHAHKQSCKNEKAMNHNCKLYNTIRNSGGWDNWQMEIIAFHNCNDSYEARKKEHEYFEKLGATLNSIDPLPKPKIKKPPVKIKTEKTQLFCEQCKLYFSCLKAQDAHNDSNKHHKMVANDCSNKTELTQISSQKFICECCCYYTSNKKDYEKHLLTSKHKKKLNGSNLEVEEVNKIPVYTCECSKTFKTHGGLWKHKQKCAGINLNSNDYTNEDKEESEVKLLTNMILAVVKQNQEILKENTELKHIIMETQTQMIKVIEIGTHNVVNNTKFT